MVEAALERRERWRLRERVIELKICFLLRWAMRRIRPSAWTKREARARRAREREARARERSESQRERQERGRRGRGGLEQRADKKKTRIDRKTALGVQVLTSSPLSRESCLPRRDWSIAEEEEGASEDDGAAAEASSLADRGAIDLAPLSSSSSLAFRSKAKVRFRSSEASSV